MAFNYMIEVEGNKVKVFLRDGGKIVRRAFAYIRGEGSAKDVAQAVAYASSRLYRDWKNEVCVTTSVDINEDELAKAIKAHDEEMKNERALY